MFITLNFTTISTKYLHYVETRQVKEIMQLVCGGLGVQECGEVLHHLPTLPQHLHIECDGVMVWPTLPSSPSPSLPASWPRLRPTNLLCSFHRGPGARAGVTGQ